MNSMDPNPEGLTGQRVGSMPLENLMEQAGHMRYQPMPAASTHYSAMGSAPGSFPEYEPYPRRPESPATTYRPYTCEVPWQRTEPPSRPPAIESPREEDPMAIYNACRPTAEFFAMCFRAARGLMHQEISADDRGANSEHNACDPIWRNRPPPGGPLRLGSRLEIEEAIDQQCRRPAEPLAMMPQDRYPDPPEPAGGY